MRASVMAFTGNVSGEREANSAYSALMPSQQAIDNQWYLYYLCREYESGRLPRAQYCAASSALWKRITGSEVSPDGCLAAAEETLAAMTETARPAPTPSGVGAEAGRWAALVPGGGPVELYGPVEVLGSESFVFDNRAGCMSLLQPDSGLWRETILVGARCAPWVEFSVERSGDRATITADGERLVLEPSEGPFREWDGRWVGEFYVERKVVPKLLTAAVGAEPLVTSSTVRVEVSINGEEAVTHWPATGCSGRLTPSGSGVTFRAYREAVPLPCMSGATVTLRALSERSVLIEWIPAAGVGPKAVGVLHRSAPG